MVKKVQKKNNMKKRYKNGIEPIVEKNSMFEANVYYYIIQCKSLIILR